MDPKSISAEISAQADDFLAGVTRRDEARAGIAEWLTIYHGKLPSADQQMVIDQVMRLLGREGFFESEAGGEG